MVCGTLQKSRFLGVRAFGPSQGTNLSSVPWMCRDGTARGRSGDAVRDEVAVRDGDEVRDEDAVAGTARVPATGAIEANTWGISTASL